MVAMNKKIRAARFSCLFTGAIVAYVFLCAPAAIAQVTPVVPGAADPSRVAPQPAVPSPSLAPRTHFSTEGVVPPLNVPKNAGEIQFVARDILLSGVTQFPPEAFSAMTTPLKNTQITLADIYALASQITLAYRKAGYLLSYAFIPDQQIANGTVMISVVEGHIADIVVDGKDPNAFITRQYCARITGEKPLRESTLESNLLRINDLPGHSYRAVLSKPQSSELDAFRLTLIPHKKAPSARLGYDNFNSRYLGPSELNAQASASLAPLQQTSLSVLNSIPFDRINYVQLTHSVAAFADVTLDATASYVHSKPEFRLEPLDIESSTSTFSAGINYQFLRQRDENLLLGFHAGSRHVTSNIFTNTLLTRDEIRTVKASLSYDVQDKWQGANIINVDFTQGIPILGSSRQGDNSLSRAQARADFSKAELTITRYQSITENFSALVQGSGQLASSELYASEEFGIGGQSFGRAYDNSEIVGDNGLVGSLELRYHGLRKLQPINLEPFMFVDSGFVTNLDAAQEGFQSLTSIGTGVRFASNHGQSGLVGVAFPLSKNPDAPLYGLENHGPRILLQFVQQF